MRRLLPFLVALVSTLALAGGPGPAPFNSGSQQIFDASSSPTTPNYLTIDSTGAAKVAGTISNTTGTNLSTSDTSKDIFGNLVGTTRYNLIEVPFFDNTVAGTLVTNTATGSGTFTQSGGHAIYATSASVNSDSKGVSVQTTEYRAGEEEYAYFTASFTVPTSANTFERIGLYDTNNGFYVGYEGLAGFEASIRTGATDTHVARASFSDPLDGSASSQFTRKGVPEAVDFTKSNVFRIRFGWLGSAPIRYEILSPDGLWVTFYTILQPNTAVLPSIQNPNLPVTLHVAKAAADAQVVTMTTGCWGAGSASPNFRISDAITDTTLAQQVRSVIVGHTTAGGGSYVNVKVNPAGSLTTADGADSTPGSAANAVSLQVAGSDGTNTRTILTDTTGAVKTIVGAPTAANILAGRQSFSATTGATTLITIPAGKTFTGQLSSSVSCAEAAAGTVSCTATAAFTTVGAGTTPAAGAVFDCDARAGANAATGSVGSQGANFCTTPIVVNCSTGTCTIAVASTNAGTSSLVTASALGSVQ